MWETAFFVAFIAQYRIARNEKNINKVSGK